jgi:hypothetical protein
MNVVAKLIGRVAVLDQGSVELNTFDLDVQSIYLLFREPKQLAETFVIVADYAVLSEMVKFDQFDAAIILMVVQDEVPDKVLD